MKTALYSALFVTLAACVGDRDISGNGHLVDEQRTVAAFHAVQISDGLKAEISIGTQNVALRLDDNIMDRVSVFVRDGVLVLEAEQREMGFDPSPGAVIRIASPTIDGVTILDGSGATAESRSTEISVRSEDGARLVLDARNARVIHATARDGSSIILTGASPALDLDTEDGSNIDSRIAAESIAVRSHDGSEVRARASKSVRVLASDGSNVHIAGNPPSREISSVDGSSVDFGE